MQIPKGRKYDNTEIVVKKVNNFEKPTFTHSLDSPKDVDRFIKKAEQFVRGSMEYKEYIHYLKNEIEMTHCSFFPNVEKNGGKERKVKIEIHHEPFTLYDITQIVTSKWMKEGKKLSHLGIAEEVMKLHFQGRVGLIPLVKTVHELVHDGQVFIPLQNVYGNFVSFVQEYGEYMNEDYHDILKTKIKLSKSVEHDYSVLDKKLTYLEVEGMELPQPYEV